MHRIGQVQSSDPTSITRAQTRLMSCRSAELLRLVCVRLNCLSGCLCPLATHHSSTGTFKQGPDAGFGGFRPCRQLEKLSGNAHAMRAQRRSADRSSLPGTVFPNHLKVAGLIPGMAMGWPTRWGGGGSCAYPRLSSCSRSLQG